MLLPALPPPLHSTSDSARAEGGLPLLLVPLAPTMANSQPLLLPDRAMGAILRVVSHHFRCFFLHKQLLVERNNLTIDMETHTRTYLIEALKLK